MRGKEGNSTVTYRFVLHYRHRDWIEDTKRIYNDVLLFYYQLLLNYTELLESGNQKILRKLEVLTIAGKDNQPEHPIPYIKVPLYLRRAAINAAIGLVRTYHTKYKAWCEDSTKEKPETAKVFNAQPLLYKGMYKEFGEDSIQLKLFTGKSWTWVKHKFNGRSIPKESETLSPTLAVYKNKVMLHVPVKSKVQDIRTVGERVIDSERICSVVLSSNDILAVCTVMELSGTVIDSSFIRGGNELKHRRKCLLGKIAKNHRLTGGIQKGMSNNVELYTKINNVTEYYSHLVSRRILDFCKKHGVKIIVFHHIEKIILVNQFTDVRANDFIIQRVIKYVRYKAFAEGIVVTTVRPNYTSCKCYKCRTYVKKYKKMNGRADNNGKHFVCENGHQGNVYLNTSKNIGLMFLKKAELMKLN